MRKGNVIDGGESLLVVMGHYPGIIRKL